MGWGLNISAMNELMHGEFLALPWPVSVSDDAFEIGIKAASNYTGNIELLEPGAKLGLIDRAAEARVDGG
jgi:hypothetical protein